MASALRWIGSLVAIALVIAAAAAEVTWMGDRVAAHRASRAWDHTPYVPAKIINLPLTGLK